MKKRSRVFSWLLRCVALLVILGSIAVVVLSNTDSGVRIEQLRRRVKAAEEAFNNARARAKRLAEIEVAKSLSPKKVKKSARVTVRRVSLAVRRRCGFESLGGGGGDNRRYDKTPMPKGELQADDQEVMDVAQEAIDEGDFATVKDVAEVALQSKDPRVRMRAVETLGNFGEVALPQLSDFLLDPHPEVANLAADRYELGAQDLKRESERVAIAKLGMLSISDEDRLRSMAATLRMANDRWAILSALTDVILDGNRAQSEAAKEAYELETGEAWVDLDTADKWLEENCEPIPPDEDDEDEDESDPESDADEESEDDAAADEDEESETDSEADEQGEESAGDGETGGDENGESEEKEVEWIMIN